MSETTLEQVKEYLTLRREHAWILDPTDAELNRRSIEAVESAIKEHEKYLEMEKIIRYWCNGNLTTQRAKLNLSKMIGVDVSSDRGECGIEFTDYNVDGCQITPAQLYGNNQIRMQLGLNPIAGAGPYTNHEGVFVCDPASDDEEQ